MAVALAFAAASGEASSAFQPTVSPTTAATPDRLLEPTLPASPTAADLGAQVFWLYCMPCHGDRGQGLTAEFRQLYPTTEQDCWKSGCHGDRPYEDGFTLPRQIPVVIGDEVIRRFPTMAALDAFVRIAMPRQAPGSLAAEQYDQVIAYLSRENDLPLEADVPVPTVGQAPSPAPTIAHLRPEPRPSVFPWPAVTIAIGVLATAVIFAAVLRRRRRSGP